MTRVFNATRAATVAGEAEVAQGPVKRGLGLMGRRGWDGSDGLVLERCNAVHSFFMRMPIDVLYVDRDNRVRRAQPWMKPWRVGPIVRGGHLVIELPAGTIDRTGTREGDQLELVDADYTK